MVHDTKNPFELTSLVVADLCRLPAVPTSDWCDAAAATFLHILPKSIAVVLVGEVDQAGDFLRVHATGAAGRFVSDPPLDSDGTPDAQLRADALWMVALHDLRSNALDLRRTGWATGAADPDQPQAAMIVESDESTKQIFGPRHLFDAVEAAEIIAGRTLLGDPALGRNVVVYVGNLERASPVPAGAVGVLRACLPLLARRADAALGRALIDPTCWLSKREQGVLERLVVGRSMPEIANELGRSPHTIQDAMKSLHRKLGVSSRGQLIARALGAKEAVNPE